MGRKRQGEEASKGEKIRRGRGGGGGREEGRRGRGGGGGRRRGERRGRGGGGEERRGGERNNRMTDGDSNESFKMCKRTLSCEIAIIQHTAII